MSNRMESDPTDPVLHRWQEEGPLTLDADNIYVGLMRSYGQNEAPPEAPTGVVIQMSVDFMGVPMSLVAKFDTEEAERFAEQFNICIESVKTGRLPEPAE